MHIPMTLRPTGLLVLILTLPAQTPGPLTKQGRYWVQTVTGSIPAGERLRVSSTGKISVSGEQEGRGSLQRSEKAQGREREGGSAVA